jgi:hypothetical protein
MRLQLPVLSQLLHKTAFLLDYVLVVLRGSPADVMIQRVKVPSR